MGKSKRRGKRGMVLMAVGLLFLTASFSLAFYNIWDSSRADRASQEVVGKLKEQIEDDQGEDAGKNRANNLKADQEMPVIEIDGNGYIGLLEIPSQGLSLPVMADWDYDKLKNAPCRYYGSYYLDNMVIAAHNYTCHFGTIKWLKAGSDVFFTDVQGKVYHYTVGWTEILQPQAIDGMISGDWDLTLFTCTTSGESRCTVRCIRERSEKTS